jgi:hypothetical protein
VTDFFSRVRLVAVIDPDRAGFAIGDLLFARPETVALGLSEEVDIRNQVWHAAEKDGERLR